MKAEASVEIARRIEEVFDFTRRHVPEWSRIVVAEEVIKAVGEGEAGTTFRVTTNDRGQEMVFDGTVTHCKPPTEHAVTMKGEQFDIDAEYFFEDLGDSTRVTQRTEVHPKGGLKFMFFAFAWLMQVSSGKAAEEELMNLKRIMEEQGE